MLAFAARPYIKLVELISRPEVKSISTESGVNYQIELNVFWGLAARERSTNHGLDRRQRLASISPAYRILDHETRWDVDLDWLAALAL
jgi:hypothetical protein